MHPYGHGGDIITAAQAAGAGTDQILDFSANINPLGTPPGLLDFLAQSLPLITRYPDPACRALYEAIRQRYETKAEIAAGNGAAELIYLLPRLTAPRPVLLTAPTFMLYERAALASGSTVHYHETCAGQLFQLDVGAFCARIRRIQPGLVVICNPNNPTGSKLDGEEILFIAGACAETGSLLAVDEAFIEFCDDYGRCSLLGDIYSNVVVIRSLTKIFALPGLRLGFLAGPGDVINKINALRDPWSVNTLAQLAGCYVLADTDFVDRTVSEVAQLSASLLAGLSSVPGIKTFPPAANYIFLQSINRRAQDLQRELLKELLLIRDCGNYRGLDDSYFRVAVRPEEENRLLLAALHRVGGGL
jgi:threonine-phosphate decarboxylase